MSRYYQTATPQYVDDFVYQPPWKLIEAIGAKKQQDYDTTLASANLLRDIQVNHLNSEDENYNVKEIQKYYNTRVDSITDMIKKDGLNTTAYMNELDKLKREITQDFTGGNISKIQGSYNNLKQWQEDPANKKLRETDPSRYTAAYNSYLNKWSAQGGNSLKSQWNGELVTPGLDYEGMRKSIGELKASSVKGSRTTPAGNLYMVERSGKQEELTERELNEWLLSQVITPSNLASLKQSQQFGLGTYTNEQGQFDWDNGTLFAPLRGMARAGAYSNNEEEIKYSSDGAAIARMNEAGQNARWSTDRQDKLNKDALDRQDAAGKEKAVKIDAIRMAMINAQAEGDSTKFDLLEKELGSLEGTTQAAGTQFGALFNTWGDVLTAAKKGDNTAETLRNRTESQIRKSMGLKKGSPQEQFIRELGAAITSGQVTEDNIDSFLQKKVPQKISTKSQLSPRGDWTETKVDAKAGERNTLRNLANTYFEKANSIWDKSKTQDTYMNFAPTSISVSGQAAKEMNQVIDSDAFSFYDINGSKKNKPVSVKDVSGIDVGNKFGGVSFIVTGEDGERYIARGNNNYSPIVNHVSNIVANGISNKAMSENYMYATNPIAREIKAKINATTTVGSTGGKFNIAIPTGTGKKTLDVTYDSSGKVRVFDGPMEMTKNLGPQDPISISKALEAYYSK